MPVGHARVVLVPEANHHVRETFCALLAHRGYETRRRFTTFVERRLADDIPIISPVG